MTSKSDELTKKASTTKNMGDKTTKRKSHSKKMNKSVEKTAKSGGKEKKSGDGGRGADDTRKVSNDSVTKNEKISIKQSKESGSNGSKSPIDIRASSSLTSSSSINSSRMNLMMLVSFVIVGILTLCFSITLATTVILKKDIGLDPSVRSLVSECLNSPEAAKLPNKRCLYISHYYHENCTHVKCNVARFSSNDTLKYTRDDKRLFMIKAKEASPCAPNRQCVPSGTAQGMVIRSGKPVLKCTAKSNQSFPLSPPLSEWTESCRVEPCLLDSLTEDKETLDLLKNIHYGCGTDWPSKIEWCKDQMQKIIPSVQFFECQFTAERGSKYCAENDAQPLIQFSICRYCDPKRNETVAGSNSIGVYLKNIVCPEGDQLLTEKDACSYRCGKHAATALPAGRPCNVEMHTADVGYYCFFGQCLPVSTKKVKLGLDCAGQ